MTRSDRRLEGKVALVTGVTSGIGRETADLLMDRGARVFGTAREPGSVTARPGLEVVRMDVSDTKSVDQGVREVLDRAGALDFVINNAGSLLLGAIEETSLEEARGQFETNFFGVLRVTRAVLPEMRKKRTGRIVNMSSALGFLPAPYMGIYAASKHALEGYTETLDHEVRPFGIRAILVEPGFTRTNLGTHQKTAAAPLEAYKEEAARVIGWVGDRIAAGDPPSLVAGAVLEALTAKVPSLRYPVGQGRVLSLLRRYVPAGMFDRRLRKQYLLRSSISEGAQP